MSKNPSPTGGNPEEPKRPATPAVTFDRSLTVGFTTAEYASLIENAASSGLSDRDYVRHALDRAGAFKRPKA